MADPGEAPAVLVLGSTGQTGRLIVEELDREPGGVHLRLCSRRLEAVQRLRDGGWTDPGQRSSLHNRPDRYRDQ